MPRIRVQRCSRSATPAWICVRCRTPAPLRGLARKPYLLRAETLSLAQRYAAGWRRQAMIRPLTTPRNRGTDDNASRAWAGYVRRHYRGARWPAATACSGHPQRHRRGDLGRQPRCRFLRRRRASSRRLRRLRAGRGAGDDRGAHQPHAPRLGGDRAELGRSGSRGAAVRHPRRRIEWARGGHPRPRLLHRILSLVRIRAQPVRGAVRRQARSVRGADPAGARDLAGQDAARAGRPACVPADRAER
jgi:hypothetical protein